MVHLNSNGTGGGPFDNVATWAGGAAFPATGDTYNVLNGDVVVMAGAEASGNGSVDDGGVLELDATAGNTIYTLDAGAALTSNTTGVVRFTGNTVNRCRIISGGAASASGNPWDIDFGGAGSYVEIGASLDVQFDINTGGSGVNFSIIGDVTVDGITKAIGDNFLATIAGVTITGNPAKTINFGNGGLTTINGTGVGHITITGCTYLNLNGGAVIDWQYLDVVGATWGLLIQGNPGSAITITQLDNCTFTGPTKSALYNYNTATSMLYTNCTFTGPAGGGRITSDVFVLSPAAFDSCILTNDEISMEDDTYPSQAFFKDYGGVANDYRLFGIGNTSDYAVGYRAVDWAAQCEIQILNCVAYATPFNSRVVLDESHATCRRIVKDNGCSLLKTQGSSKRWIS